MKFRLIMLAFTVTLLISFSAFVSTVDVEANTGCQGWTVDIGDPMSEAQAGIQINGWSTFIGGSAGIGSYGGTDDCRVIWDPGGDRCATVKYSYYECTAPVCLEWICLDGQALDDGYEVYVDGIKVFTYINQVTPETWFSQSVNLLPFELTCQNEHTIEFCATGAEPWSGFDTYGQVAIDMVELGTETCTCSCPDCEEPGDRDLNLVVEILEPDCICINISSIDLNFGSLYPGQTSATEYFQIANCGTVPVDITASTSNSFFENNLMLEGSSWHNVESWALDHLQPATNQTLGAYITVPVGYQAGIVSGQLIFWAEKSID